MQYSDINADRLVEIKVLGVLVYVEGLFIFFPLTTNSTGSQLCHMRVKPPTFRMIFLDGTR